MRAATPLAALSLLSLVALGVACDDRSPPIVEEEPTDELLAAPPEGQGFQFGTPEITVDPGVEQQNCYFFRVRDLMEQNGLDASKPINLHHVQLQQSKGSHHMNIFRVRTIVQDNPETEQIEGLDPAKGPSLDVNGVGPCFVSSNWADWPLVANTQQDGTIDWKFPDGVANKLDPDEWLMLQSHYVNASTQKTPDGFGKVLVNFWHLPDEEVVHEMGTLFATKQSIRVCQSNPAPEFGGSCQFNSPEPVTIVGANGHFHSRGKQFDMYAWDGTSVTTPSDEARFYESDVWDEPIMAIGDSLAQVPANGGVFYTCEYQWTPPPQEIGCTDLNEYDMTKYGTSPENTDCCYTFGPVVDRNEHCNIFVYYYPKADDINCF